MRFTNCPKCGAHVVHRRDGAVARHKSSGGNWCEGGARLSVSETVRERAIREGRPTCKTCGRPVTLNKRREVCLHHAPGGKVCRGPEYEIVNPAVGSADLFAYQAAKDFGYASPKNAPTPEPVLAPVHADPLGGDSVERIVRLDCGHHTVVRSARSRIFRRCRVCRKVTRELAA